MTHARTPIHRTYSNLEKLLSIYHWIEQYIESHGFPPSNMELVDAGFAGSTSVIRYYYSRMIEMDMLKLEPNIARGIRLLPLAEASEEIRLIVE